MGSLSSQPTSSSKARPGHPQERERRKKPKQTRKKGVRKARAKNAIGIKEKKKKENPLLIHPHSGDHHKSINSPDPENPSGIPFDLPPELSSFPQRFNRIVIKSSKLHFP